MSSGFLVALAWLLWMAIIIIEVAYADSSLGMAIRAALRYMLPVAGLSYIVALLLFFFERTRNPARAKLCAHALYVILASTATYAMIHSLDIIVYLLTHAMSTSLNPIRDSGLSFLSDNNSFMLLKSFAVVVVFGTLVALYFFFTGLFAVTRHVGVLAGIDTPPHEGATAYLTPKVVAMIASVGWGLYMLYLG